MKVFVGLIVVALIAAFFFGAREAKGEVIRPMCHANDDGSWTYVLDHYDDARDGGHIADRMANSDGTCSWPAVSAAPKAVTVTKTVTKVKTITRRCVVVKKKQRTVRRPCVVKVAWS